jgi:hypothetical protein
MAEEIYISSHSVAISASRFSAALRAATCFSKSWNGYAGDIGLSFWDMS